MAPPEANTISLDLLRTLVTFSELGRVEETARHLKLTQAAVSLQLKKLETELKVPLFKTVGRKKTLTEEAKDLVLNLAPLFKSFEETFQQSLKKKAMERDFVLRIGSPKELMQRVLQMIQHSGPLKLYSFDEEDCARALREDQIDLAILTRPMEGSAFQCKKLFQDPIRLVLHKSLVKPGIADLESLLPILLSTPVVSYNEETLYLDELAHQLNLRKSDFDRKYFCEDWRTVCDLVRMTQSWALIPDQYLNENKDLEIIPLEIIKPIQYYGVLGEQVKDRPLLIQEM